MNKYLKKIKLLRDTILDVSKMRPHLRGLLTEELLELEEDLEIDLEWVDTIYNRMKTYQYNLIRLEMKRCNTLYKKYKRYKKDDK